MKILQLHNAQLSPGGATNVVNRERAELEARGHECMTLWVSNEQVQEIGHARAAARAVWNRDIVRQLRESVEAFTPDVVHVHTPFPLMSPAVFSAAHRLAVPVVTTVHGWRYNCIKGVLFRDGAICEACLGKRLKYPGLVHRCYHDSLAGSLAMTSSLAIHRGIGTFSRCVDRWLALTPRMRDYLVKEGISPSRVVVKPNSAPDPGPPLAARDGYACFVGRLVPEKGIQTLVDAWSNSDLDVPLVIAGDGPLRGVVAAANERDRRIDLRGWLEKDQLTSLLARAEVLVLPSEWYEGLPLSMLESFAAGTPVIASDVGNFSDIIVPGVNGTRFRSGDAADLARAVREFFTSADRDGLRRGARTTYDESFRNDVVIDMLEAVYADVMEAGRP